jgi:hypothetical protein
LLVSLALLGARSDALGQGQAVPRAADRGGLVAAQVRLAEASSQLC